MSLALIRQSTEFLNYKEFGSETELSENDIPKAPRNRKATDVWCLFVFFIFLFITLCLVGYTLTQSDISRLNKHTSRTVTTYGDVSDQSSWSDLQWNRKPIEKPENTENSDNDDNNPYGRNKRDVFTDDNKNIAKYFSKVGWRLATTCLISLGLCIGIVPMYRYATSTVVWGTLILSWLILFIINVKLWQLTIQYDSQPGIIFSTVLSIIVLVFLLLLFALAKKVKLVIMMFKETMKATFDMPKLYFIPAVVIFFAWIILALWLITTIYMSSAVTDTESNELEDGNGNTLTYLSILFNVVIGLWVLEILHGIMYMIISGAVAKWYFTGDKTHLGNPVLTSTVVTFKFHLGTVALGAFITTLVTIIRILLRSLSNGRLKYFIDCLFARIQAVLRIFTHSAYIVTAMHGTPFFKSGVEAVKLYGMNICNVVSVYTIGNFVIVMSNIFVIGVCLIITYLLVVLDMEGSQYEVYSFILVAVVAGLCCYTILGTITIVSNTILICFCEDCVINDGTTRPYAMPRSLMEFVDASKQVFGKVIAEKGLPTI